MTLLKTSKAKGAVQEEKQQFESQFSGELIPLSSETPEHDEILKCNPKAIQQSLEHVLGSIFCTASSFGLVAISFGEIAVNLRPLD
jgi:hypothetical protein